MTRDMAYTHMSKASVAVIARKGGVGKSTIAGNLAVALEEIGHAVVALDADPQGSLAAWTQMRDPEAETDARTIRAWDR